MKLKCIFAVFLTLIYYHYSFKIHKDTGKFFFISNELILSSACYKDTGKFIFFLMNFNCLLLVPLFYT